MSAEKRIIFVPGKNPKPNPLDHKKQLWRCLLHGIYQVNPDIAKAMATESDCFTLAAWNKLYYHQEKPIGPLLPWIDRLCLLTGASEQDRREARSWRRKLAKIFITMADYLPWLIPIIPDPAVKASVKETTRYFNNTNNIASQIRGLLKRELISAFEQQERILLIGHSMGSVIAFDTLWELWFEDNNRQQIDFFLTLGSPLGMHFVQKRLKNANQPPDRRFPGNIRRWKNISSEGDLVALDTTVHDDYQTMIERSMTEFIDDKCKDVYNYFRDEKGLNVHRSYGYLVNKVVGKTIAHWWQESS